MSGFNEQNITHSATSVSPSSVVGTEIEKKTSALDTALDRVEARQCPACLLQTGRSAGFNFLN